MTTHALLGPTPPELGWVPASRYLMRRARVHALARELRPGRSEEVGPDAGTLMIEFADRGIHCEVPQPSIEAREVAQRLLAGPGQSIDVQGEPGSGWRGRYDALLAFDVLEHIEHDTAALSKWFDRLRPGHLLLCVPAHMHLWTAGEGWVGRRCRRYAREPLLAPLRARGFAVESFECCGFPLSNFTERVSAPIYRRSPPCGRQQGRRSSRQQWPRRR